MNKLQEMRELLDKADKVKPLAEVDGQIYADFEDAATLNNIAKYNGDETGMQVRNPDGSIASTGKTIHAINPDYFFANRYKVKGKKMYVVSGHEPTGFRCIQEQKKGRTFIKTIPCYVFSRDENKELVLEKTATVTESEFVSDYTGVLTNEAMAELLPMITSHGVEVTKNDMPI